jgi:hypothetical protein
VPVLRPQAELGETDAAVLPDPRDRAPHRYDVAEGVERAHAKAGQLTDPSVDADELAHAALPHALQEHDVRVHVGGTAAARPVGVVVDRVEVTVGTGLHDQAIHRKRERDGG